MIELPEQYPRNLPNCGVIATSIISRIPYEQVWDYIGRNKSGNWKGRTYPRDLSNALEYFNVRHKIHICVDLPLFQIEQILKPNRSYALHVHGHYLTYRSGWLIDQYGVIPLSLYPRQKRVVKDMIESFE